MGIIGGHGRRLEHQDMTLSRSLLIAIFASYTIFGALGEHLTHVSRPATRCESNLLSTLDTLAFTD